MGVVWALRQSIKWGPFSFWKNNNAFCHDLMTRVMAIQNALLTWPKCQKRQLVWGAYLVGAPNMNPSKMEPLPIIFLSWPNYSFIKSWNKVSIFPNIPKIVVIVGGLYLVETQIGASSKYGPPINYKILNIFLKYCSLSWPNDSLGHGKTILSIFKCSNNFYSIGGGPHLVEPWGIFPISFIVNAALWSIKIYVV